MVTIDDIAKRLGVSKSTVSRYLNGGSVSQKTREKIEAVIAETGYHPNAFARSLKAKHTHIIGVVVPRLDSEAAVQMLHGIESILYNANYKTIITNTYQDLDREYEAIATLKKQRADGIILMSSRLTSRHIDLIKESDMPFISMGQSHEGIYSIIFDDYKAGKLVAEYLISMNHRNILFLGVTPTDESVGIRRYQGFKDTLDAHKMNHDFLEVSFNPTKAVALVSKSVDVKKYSAIVCATDNISVSMLKYLHFQGIKVPENVSLIGFGGHQLTDLVTPELDTVVYDYTQAGTIAARSILNLIDHKTVNEMTVLDVQLRKKHSVKKSELI